MRTVVTISLNGIAYQVEAEGFGALEAYLRTAQGRLTGNPDAAEILADLEQAIAEKCARYLGAHKNVVTVDEVAAILTEMGPVEAGTAAPAGAERAGGAEGAGEHAADRGAAAATGEPGTAGGADLPGAADATAGAGAGARAGAGDDAPRRFYRIHAGEVIAGVCTGIAAYFGWEVALVRLGFILLALVTWGFGILFYVALVLLIPYAETSEQHAAAHGRPFNAEEVISRARAQYAAFRDHSGWRRQRREQRRQYRQQRRYWRSQQRAWAYGGPPAAGAAWAPPCAYQPGIFGGLLATLFGVLSALLFIAFLFALLAMIRHHQILGVPLPAGVPLWLDIVVLCVLYGAVVSPLHQARHARYYRPAYAYAAPWAAVAWVVLLAVGAWYAWQHWPQLQLLLQQLARALTDLWNALLQHAPLPAAPSTPSGPAAT